ncbi:NB-ARC domain-containing protein [Microbacterium sp. NPDC076895]|uniref:ATP-binding protein n=1 Tax=Microbacterium sp. NPDC076895 TaxID=3154957 RepID=UPI00341A3A27
MQLRFFGGFVVDTDDGPAAVRGRGQEALLFRLALDAGTVVSYRTLADDLWPHDPPEDPRAALQSLASRLRRELPAGALVAAPGGYRLQVDREDVDITRFQDLVLRARQAPETEAAALAREALGLWVGEPWTPGEGFEWVSADLHADAIHARRLAAEPSAGSAAESTSAPDPAGVPAAPTALVGRTDELALIHEQLQTERLVTLIGPGGAGKTTLALETARRAPDAIVVALAPVASGDLWSAVSGAVGRTVRVAEATASSGAVSARARVFEALAGRAVLVLLDNCEHVVDEAASVALDLLLALPKLRLLATSREPLGVSGEAFVPIGPLPREDADELFARRVRAARATPVTDEERAVAVRIAERLDGLPLALELAAAKARTLTLAEIDAGLADRFALLTGGPRTADSRHRTLRALIDWSWETLTVEERSALQAMAVFPDGIGAADAGHVADALGLDRAVFENLVERSLAHRSAGRFQMLETVREYGAERLRESGDEPRIREIQARVMADRANSQDALLRGPRVREGLAWFDANEENLAVALRACAATEDLTTGLALTRGCLWVWMLRERLDDLAPAALRHRAVPLGSEAAVVVRGLAVIAGMMVGTVGDAVPQFDEDEAQSIAAAATRYPESELAAVLPPLLSRAGEIWQRRMTNQPWSRSIRLPEASELAQLPLWSQAMICLLVSVAAQNDADLDAQGAASLQSLETFQKLGDQWGVAFASLVRADWLTAHGELEEALVMLDDCRRTLEGLVSVADLAQQGGQAVFVLVRMGRLDEARARVTAMRAAATVKSSAPAMLHVELATAAIEVASVHPEAALESLARIPSGLDSVPTQFQALAHYLRTEALVQDGRLDDARVAIAEGFAQAIETADQPVMAWGARTAALWLEAAGRETDARRALALSIRLRGRLDLSEPAVRGLHERLGAETETDAPLDAEALRALLG